jgi:hypothetical protein
MKARLEHLDEVIEKGHDPEVIKKYFVIRLNRIIVDYLLREGHFDSAKQFIDENKLKVLL